MEPWAPHERVIQHSTVFWAWTPAQTGRRWSCPKGARVQGQCGRGSPLVLFRWGTLQELCILGLLKVRVRARASRDASKGAGSGQGVLRSYARGLPHAMGPSKAEKA